MSKVVCPENIPLGTSWVYLLDAKEASQQCQVFGITPAPTLAANRVLLCDFLTNLKINGGSLDLPENHCPEFFSSDVSGQPSGVIITVTQPSETSDLLLPGLDPQLPSTVASLAGGKETYTSTVSSNQKQIMAPFAAPPPVQDSTEPPWQQLISATAAAVGESIARALTTANIGATPHPNFDSCPRVLQDLVNRIPITSGSDPRKFVEFLIQVEKVRQLNLADSRAILVSLLPRTTNQLRTAWTRAVADNIPIQDLIQSLLGFFLPHRLRHSIVSDLLYRSQRPNEPLAEFISDLQDCKSLLMPSLSQGELLEIALTGINQETRSHLAGFPAPLSVDELLALAPRIEVIARMHSASTSSVPPRFDFQPNRQNNGRYNNGSQRADFSQNRQPYRTFQPSRFSQQHQNSQRGYGQARFQRPRQAETQPNSNATPQSGPSGQLNSRGGH